MKKIAKYSTIILIALLVINCATKPNPPIVHYAAKPKIIAVPVDTTYWTDPYLTDEVRIEKHGRDGKLLAVQVAVIMHPIYNHSKLTK